MGCAVSQEETFSLEDLGVIKKSSAIPESANIKGYIREWKCNTRTAKIMDLTTKCMSYRLELVRMSNSVGEWRRNMKAENIRLKKKSSQRHRVIRIAKVQKQS